jgi:hypothetical protein
LSSLLAELGGDLGKEVGAADRLHITCRDIIIIITTTTGGLASWTFLWNQNPLELKARVVHAEVSEILVSQTTGVSSISSIASIAIGGLT